MVLHVSMMVVGSDKGGWGCVGWETTEAGEMDEATRWGRDGGEDGDNGGI